jgi:DNA-binding transcriptional ArsR family regulator
VSKQTVWTPALFALARGLNAPAKLVWLLHAHAAPEPPASLHRAAGLDRRTVLTALDKLTATGWLKPQAKPGAPPVPNRRPPAAVTAGVGGFDVRYYAALLTDTSLSAEARVLYGQLQALGSSRSHSGEFTYRELSQRIGSTPPTLRQACAELVNAGWLTLEQPNRKRPIRFTLRNATWDDPVERARHRIERAPHTGEAIMREFLTLLVDSDQYKDDEALPIMVNPYTGERLELDRYYESDKVAFEFNGPQHYRQVQGISWDDFVKQVMRDRAKGVGCEENDIALVKVHAADLSLTGMKAKVGNLLPLRTLTDDDGRLIRMLEGKAEGYRAKSVD